MVWPSFVGALVGGVIGVLLILGAFLIWDEYARRRTTQPAPVQKRLSLDDVLESHLEQHIVQNFEQFFPGWRIHSLDLSAEGTNQRASTLGVRLRTLAGEIDMLCIDSAGDFVVIELKRNKTPDTVVAQVDRYMVWVENNLAQPGQKVRGLIIAKSLNQHLAHTLTKRPEIEFWSYRWLLELDHYASEHASQKDFTESNENVEQEAEH